VSAIGLIAGPIGWHRCSDAGPSPLVLRLPPGRGGGAGRRGLFPRETVRRRLLLFHPPGSCRCIGRTSRAAWIARRPPWSGRRSSSAPRALEAEGGVPHGGLRGGDRGCGEQRHCRAGADEAIMVRFGDSSRVQAPRWARNLFGAAFKQFWLILTRSFSAACNRSLRRPHARRLSRSPAE
jgi:hypothetical protein